MRGRIRFTYSRDWHRPNRSATAGSFYFYRHRRFNGEEKNPAKLQQQPYTEAMHVPSSRPWNSKFARHKHDHYAYKRSMKTEVSNRRRKTTRSMYTVIYSVHICTIFDSEASRSTCLYWKLLHSKRGCINAETLLWIDKNWIEEKRRALFSLRILLYLFRLNSRETRFGIVITLQRKFPYRSCTSEGTKIRSTGEVGWEQAYIKSEGDRRWFMGADALVVWHSVYRGRRWSKRWRILATDSSKWRSLHSARSTTLCFSLAEIKLCLSPISRNSIEINIFFPNVVKTKDYSKRSRKNRSEEGEKRKNIYSV